MTFDDHTLIEYLRRSYHAVDGLWFMKAEEAEGFEHALALDEQVWAVLAKIQARKARELLECHENSPEELGRCFALKLAGDGHECDLEMSEDGVRVRVRGCPWADLLGKSDRRHLAERVARTICPTEGRVWCQEFGGEYEFRMPAMMCSGDEACEMRFERQR